MRNLIQWFTICLGSSLLVACGPNADTNTAAVMPAADGDYERGPHNGRMLRDGDIAVELAIFETGVPPEFRVWVTADGQAVDPTQVDMRATLTRLGGSDNIAFDPRGDYLRGDQVIYEPHSFAVALDVTYQGRGYRWEYESFEGRTRIDPAMAEALGIETQRAGPATITDLVSVYGSIVVNPGRIREISARFDGLIESVEVMPGESVRQGQRLATVESNESLRSYTIEAPLSGVVMERAANPGEQTNGRRLFILVDTSSVWAEFAVFPGDRSRVALGDPVRIVQATGDGAAEASIVWLSPVAGANQAVTARAELENGDGRWVLGSFVSATIEVDEFEVPLAVRRSGLQSFRDFTVVFARFDDEYEVRMLDLGRQDGVWAEVLGGIEPGTPYVTANSYLLKADIEKSGASHDH